MWLPSIGAFVCVPFINATVPHKAQACVKRVVHTALGVAVFQCFGPALIEAGKQQQIKFLAFDLTQLLFAFADFLAPVHEGHA